MENKHIWEIMFLFVIFGMFISYMAFNSNQYDYVCVDENMRGDIYYEYCMEDCNSEKYECLSNCGCENIESKKKSFILQMVVGGVVGFGLWATYMSFKGY